MAISTDDPTEKASVSEELDIEDNADVSAQPDSAAGQNEEGEAIASADGSALFFDTVAKGNREHAEVGRHEDPADDADTEETVAPIPESDRKEEVPALLGREMISDDEEQKILPDEEAEVQAAAPKDTANNEEEVDKVASAAITVESGNSAEEHAAAAAELKIILESLQDSLANTQYISSKIDAVSSDTEGLVKQVNTISLNHELLAAEMETLSSGASTKGTLSKTFLIIASSLLALLVIFQIYMFVSLSKIQRLQNAAGSTVLENLTGLDKKMADYNKNLTKALETSARQEHAQMNPVTVEKTGHETAENKDIGSANITTVREKMNKLRNGLPDRRLIRKETGDWFVLNKKSEESISDVEVIEVLNQAYKRTGRILSPAVPLPAHKALCILKPDGKGGTEVVMTKEFAP